MKFCFGDIVVVEGNLIGVIVKSWIRGNTEIVYEVYVRSYNNIKEYKEADIQRYMVRHKELSDEELDYQEEAYHPFITKEDIINFFGNLNLDGGKTE